MVNTLKCYNAILFNDGKWWAFGQSKFYMHTKWIICIICFLSLFSPSWFCGLVIFVSRYLIAIDGCDQMSISSQLKDNVIVSVGKWCLWRNDVELCISVMQLCSCSCSCSSNIKYVIIFFMSLSITSTLSTHEQSKYITRSRQCALFPIADKNTL